MSQREKIIFGLGAVGLILVVALVGGVVYALLKASVTTLRWWAGLMTAALPVGLTVAYALGRQAARERIAGVHQGIEAVTAAAARTVDTARQAAAVRAEAARQMRRPGPAIQQVFLPGMPGTPGGPVILPVASQEEVEL
ncbi:MAG: hypothetical protein J7575_06495 [Chloroflexi bacterium]|nr:hypothetical protein [Chloroflexota bacterium]